MKTLAEIETFLNNACGYNGVAQRNDEQNFVHLDFDFLEMIVDEDHDVLIASCVTQTTDKGVCFSI